MCDKCDVAWQFVISRGLLPTSLLSHTSMSPCCLVFFRIERLQIESEKTYHTYFNFVLHFICFANINKTFPGWGGEDCGTPFNYCASLPCAYWSECTSAAAGSVPPYTCDCTQSWDARSPIPGCKY